jgi:hypothetical protein
MILGEPMAHEWLVPRLSLGTEKYQSKLCLDTFKLMGIVIRNAASPSTAWPPRGSQAQLGNQRKKRKTKNEKKGGSKTRP